MANSVPDMKRGFLEGLSERLTGVFKKGYSVANLKLMRSLTVLKNRLTAPALTWSNDKLSQTQLLISCQRLEKGSLGY